MKKTLFGVFLILIAAVSYVLFAKSAGVSLEELLPELKSGSQKAAGVVDEVPIADITVGIADDLSVPVPLRDLLQKRLASFGFKTAIVPGFESNDARASELSTIVLKNNKPDIAAQLERTIFATNVYRKELNDDLPADVLFLVWNIDDVRWGDLAAEAAALAALKKEDATITVLNAGAEAGAAGRAADELKNAGYIQARAANAEVDQSGPSTVYYQRYAKQTAAAIVQVLKDAGYGEFAQQMTGSQDVQIMIVLTGEEAATATTTPPYTE